MEEHISMLLAFGEASKEPTEPAEESDEAMEIDSHKHQKYVNSRMEEVSDPDLWADIHYGPWCCNN